MVTRKEAPAGIGVFRLYTEKEKDSYIGALVTQFEKSTKKQKPVEEHRPFITLSRQFGCMALEIALQITERLNQRESSGPAWAVYDKEIVRKIAEDLQMSKRFVESLTERSKTRISEYMEAFFLKRSTRDEVFQLTVGFVRALCQQGHTVVIGRAGCRIGADLPGGFHVRIMAPFSWRVEQVASFYDLGEKEAAQRIQMIDESRLAFFQGYFGHDVSDPDLYDLVLNQERLPMELLVDLVIQGMEGKQLLSSSKAQDSPLARSL